MEDNNWYEGIEKEIGSLKEKMNKRAYQLYEMDLLSRVAKRVARFSYYCEYCQGHRNDISNLVAKLDNLPMTNEDVADYGRTFRSILKHLKKHPTLKSRNTGFILMMVGVALFVIPWMGEYNEYTNLILLGLVYLISLAGLAFFIGGLMSVIIYYTRIFIDKINKRKVLL